MSAPSNIQQFNDHVSQVFALLYENFPTPIDLGAEHFTFEAVDPNDPLGPSSLEEKFEPVAHAIRWLTEEGYLRCEGESMDNDFVAVQLTGKGLVTLNAMPAALDGRGSLGSRISDAVSRGAKQVAQKLAEEAISTGFKLMVQGSL